jgi:hypothetical protein
MTGEYTFVTAERQNELTRRIQQKLSEASERLETTLVSPSPEELPSPASGHKHAALATILIQ